VGHNPLSRVKATGSPGYSLALDAISLRRLPWDHMDQWLAGYLADEARLNADRIHAAREAVGRLVAAIAASGRARRALPKAPEELATFLPGAQIPLDPWGQPYAYRIPGLFNPSSFDVYSFRGNSRAPADWIGNWDTPFRLDAAIEGESLEVTAGIKPDRAIVQAIGSRSVPPASGGSHLFLRFAAVGDRATLALPESVKPGAYTVSLSTVTSWDYGIVQWSLDGNSLGPPLDGYSADTWRQVLVGKVATLTDRPHELEIRVLGRHPLATGFCASLDAIRLQPVGDDR
jgi:hypothetical protein